MTRRDIGRTTLGLFVLLALCCSVALAQDQATSRRVEGRQQAAGAEVVINQIDTSVFPKVTIFALVSRSGVPLKGLGPDDFRVREDEVDQSPLTVVPQLTPLNAVVTLDTSGSMKQRMKDAQAAAKSFIDMLSPEDTVRVVSFAREVKVLSIGRDRSHAKAAIDATVARGDTALYDALYTSVEQLRGVPGRKVVTLLSDGADDNGQGRPLSKHSVDDVLLLAREVNVPVFTVGVGTEIDEAVLRRVARETGGDTLIAPQPGQLKELYAKIGEQLAGQYNIFYTSNLPGDGTEHRVQLRYADAWDTKEYKAPLLKEAKPQPKPAPEPMTPPPSTPPGGEPELKVVDILTPPYAELVMAPSEKWEGLLAGDVELKTDESDKAVFGFKGDRSATFDMVRICIQQTHVRNIKSLEVLTADSPTGPFTSVGTFQPQNVRIHKTGGWQEFKFAPVTARYVKLRATSEQGAWFKVDKVEGGGKSLQLLGTLESSGAAAPPATAVPQEKQGVDILTPQYAELVMAPSEKWEGLLAGNVELKTDESDKAVFGFKGDRSATFDMVRICIQQTHVRNIKSLEVLTADSPTGPFTSVGTFQPQNVRIHKTGGWQEFKFAPVTARYVKLRATSEQGAWFKVDKLEGGGKSLQLLGMLESSGAAAPPATAVPQERQAVDILTPQYAELVVAPSEKWEGLLTGNVELKTDESDKAVFGFKGDRSATLDMVRICIQQTHVRNIKSLEVLTADSPTGPFTSVGTYQPQNVHIHKTGGWQEFKFAPVTARYVKLRATSEQGYFFRVDKLEGGGKSLQLLGKVGP